MLQLLVRQLGSSILHNEDLRIFRKKKCKERDYDELAQTIHQKLSDLDLDARTDAQIAEHAGRMNGGGKGGGNIGGNNYKQKGGGWDNTKGGAHTNVVVTDAQKLAKSEEGTHINQEW